MRETHTYFDIYPNAIKNTSKRLVTLSSAKFKASIQMLTKPFFTYFQSSNSLFTQAFCLFRIIDFDFIQITNEH